MALGAGRRLRREANDPLAGDPAMQNEVDAARRGLDARGMRAFGQYEADRGAMGGALAGLQGLATGTGPSLAQTQLQNQADANIASTMAAMGAARGGNLNAAQMGAATAGVGIQQDTNKALAEARAREQIEALNASGGLAATMAGMSSGREQGFAGMSQGALMDQYGQANQREAARAGLVANRLDQRQRNAMGWADRGLGVLETGLTAGGLMSDIRVKENVKPAKSPLAILLMGAHDEDGACPHCGRMGCKAEHETESMGDDEDDHEQFAVRLLKARDALSKTKPYEYTYTDEAREKGMPGGVMVGVMAQDLERSELGREVVGEDEDGRKVLDGKKALSLLLAGGADHEKRLRALEGRGG